MKVRRASQNSHLLKQRPGLDLMRTNEPSKQKQQPERISSPSFIFTPQLREQICFAQNIMLTFVFIGFPHVEYSVLRRVSNGTFPSD